MTAGRFLAIVARVTGFAGDPVMDPRRPGDAACVVGSAARIHRLFGWRVRHDLDEMINSAWAGWKQRYRP
jgi:UDP-glucose 4-epimerase